MASQSESRSKAERSLEINDEDFGVRHSGERSKHEISTSYEETENDSPVQNSSQQCNVMITGCTWVLPKTYILSLILHMPRELPSNKT